MTSLIRWGSNPTRDLDRFFDNVFQSYLPGTGDGLAPLAPPVDIEETHEEFIVRADLPGVSPKDVKVALLGNVLTIRGERKQTQENKSQNLHRVERRYGSFERKFRLAASVRADQVNASFRDGVLEVHVPKAEEARVREIEVQVAS